MTLSTPAPITLTLCAAVLTSVAALAYQIGHHRGESAAQTEALVRETELNTRHSLALQQATERERSTERQLGTDLSDLQTRHNQDASYAKQIRERTAAAVRTGAVRLSIPALSCVADPGAPASPGAGPAPGDRHQARAQLAPEIGLALTAIGDDGDDAIRQLNACIDAYNAVKIRLNTPTGHQPAAGPPQGGLGPLGGQRGHEVPNVGAAFHAQTQ